MAGKKKQKRENEDRLYGGISGGNQAGSLPKVGGPSGGSNTIGSRIGGSQPNRGPASPPGGGLPDPRGTANQADQDAEAALEDQFRHPSPSEAKQWARDDADADTMPGTPHGGVAPDRQVHKLQEDKD